MKLNATQIILVDQYFTHRFSKRPKLIRNQCADFIYYIAPTSVFEKFILACNEPSEERLLESFAEIQSFLSNYTPSNALSEFISQNIAESMNDYNELIEQEENKAYRKFIPVPDDSKRGKSIWMLPNLSSFTNIYARINKYLNADIAQANIFHDEQAHFDEIISLNKKLVEELKTKDSSRLYNANYDFSESASLIFSKSHENTPIQIADILAGTAMRHLQEKIGGIESSSEIVVVYDKILRYCDTSLGLGVNLVTTSKIHHELHYK